MVGISHHWGVCDTMVLYHFFKTKSPSTLTRTGRTSKPELYHTPQQLSQYDCPIKIFCPQA